MSLTPIILRGAEADLLQAFILMDAHGKQHAFDLAFDAVLHQICEFPRSAPVYEGNFRRALIRLFHYGVFYTFDTKRLYLTAVIDLRTNPSRIAERLKSPN